MISKTGAGKPSRSFGIWRDEPSGAGLVPVGDGDVVGEQHRIGPVILQAQNHCTACGRTMTAVTFLGATVKDRDPLALCCDGCGRRGVFCECKPESGHPWAAHD